MNLKSIFYWNIYHPTMMLCVKLFYYLPVKKNKIFFFHDFGNGYGDSPKYIVEEIIRRGLEYDMVWGVNREHNVPAQYPRQIRLALLSRIKFVYELATAKVIITTLKSRYNFKKKKSQFFVYVPHGQIGAKYVEAQAEGKIGDSYIEGSKWHSSVTDLVLSSSKLFTKEVRNYYWYPEGEIAETGLPRNDIFFNYTPADIKRIKNNLGIADEVKVALYAPTFRDNGNDGAYDIDVNRLLDTLERKTDDKWIFLIRLHPCFIWFKEPKFKYDSRVVNVTRYPDMQDLLLVSDILISDYSSTMFDFNLMHRPVFLYTNDVEDYQRMRGLKDWFFKVPFPFCLDNDELNEAVFNFDVEKYHAACKEFDVLYGSLDNGTAAKKLVDRLESIMQ